MNETEDVSWVEKDGANYIENNANIDEIFGETLNDDIMDRLELGNHFMYKLAVVMSNVFLFLLIFGLSATVDVTNLRKQLQNKFAVGTGIAMQFLIMPLLGFSSVLMMQQNAMSKAMGITLLVVTASPGGSYSNWWCSTFNADLALSVAMTSVSSLLSIVLLPANLLLYTFLAYGLDEEQSVVNAIDFETLFITLGIVLLGIISGLSAGYAFDNPTFHIHANRLGTICGVGLLLFSAYLSSGIQQDADTNLWTQPWSFYVSVSFPCIVGIFLSNILTLGLKLSKPECVAISIECAYQNVGIATSVAVTMFNDPADRIQAISVPLFYGLVEGLVVLIYCLIAWKLGWTKAPARENFCVIISRTYEVCDQNDNEQSRLSESSNCQHYSVEKKISRDFSATTRANGCSTRSRSSSEDFTIITTSTNSPAESPPVEQSEYGQHAKHEDDHLHSDIPIHVVKRILSHDDFNTSQISSIGFDDDQLNSLRLAEKGLTQDNSDHSIMTSS